MPSDHLITPLEEFVKLISKAISEALRGELITFGIHPTYPETGYGYIHYNPNDQNFSKLIHRFIEKPSEEKAQDYLKQENFLWNSGMILCQASAFLEAVEMYQPEVLAATQKALISADKNAHIWKVDPVLFSTSPSISVDYGILEKAEKVRVVPLSVQWSDLGSWKTLWTIDKQDEQGNTFIGDVIAHDVENSYIRSDGRLVSVIGLKNIVVIASDDAVLVANQEATQDVKKIVDILSLNERSHLHTHSVQHRPWGSFETLEKGERFQVKKITVNPGQKLSLQFHHHRSEHWTVVKGTAKVTLDQEDFILAEDETVYIPVGAQHRLENPGKLPLELIEVQCGAYLGEDDIIRIQDDYNRV